MTGLDLLLAVLLSIVIVPLAALTEGPVFGIRVALGLAFLLFVPGYAFINAVYPGRTDLEAVRRVALSIGFSIVVTVVLGFITAYMPWGFRLVSVLSTVALFNIVAASIAWLRRRASPDPFVPRPGRWLAALRAATPGEKALAGLLAVVVLASGVLLLQLVKLPPMKENFSDFYLLGPEGRAENYPGNLGVGQTARVVVGIVNREGEPREYRVELAIDGTRMAGIDRVSLAAGQTWEQPLTFAPARAGADQKVDIFLFRVGEEKAYKSVGFWIDVGAAQSDR